MQLSLPVSLSEVLSFASYLITTAQVRTRGPEEPAPAVGLPAWTPRRLRPVCAHSMRPPSGLPLPRPLCSSWLPACLHMHAGWPLGVARAVRHHARPERFPHHRPVSVRLTPGKRRAAIAAAWCMATHAPVLACEDACLLACIGTLRHVVSDQLAACTGALHQPQGNQKETARPQLVHACD